jgi:UDP-GlcNAc:undecaprenyl-phosphate GlcNAc-1-phosphate transferase
MEIGKAILFGLLGLVPTAILIPLIRRKGLAVKGTETVRMFHQTHATVVPRFGGLALGVSLLVVAVVALLIQSDAKVPLSRLLLAAAAAGMFAVGFWDDCWPLGARRKLAGQILVSVLAYLAGCQISSFKSPFSGEVYELGYWGIVATVFWLVALTNLINLIDGIDGLAAGVGLMMMLLLTYASIGSGSFPMCVSAGMAGALLGFLYFNFPPAKIYLGDGGAYLIGFMIGILTIENSQKGTVAAMLIAPLFALALPIADVVLAILRRGLKGMPIFRPDKNHLHHRLLATGFTHTQAVLVFYGISLVFLLMSLGVLWSQGRWLPILFGFLCLTFIISARVFEFSRAWFSLGRVLGNSLEMRNESQYALALSRWLELEAERCDSQDSLWNEFGFMLRKLDFARARLVSEKGSKTWQHPQLPSDAGEELRRVHHIRVGANMTLEFTAHERTLPSRLFDHLSEIAAEAWHKAVMRIQPGPSSAPEETVPTIQPDFVSTVPPTGTVAQKPAGK